MHEYETIKEVKTTLPRMPIVQAGAFQNLDLNKAKNLILATQFERCLFMGCKMDVDISNHLLKKGNNSIFPKIDVPFKMYLSKLYTKSSIYSGYDINEPESYHTTYDKKVYDHYIKNGAGEPNTIHESLARRIHDHSVTDAINDFVRKYEPKKIIAIMGGHGLKRGAGDYENICLISKDLTEKGYLMISGGGPGAMEATHVGAWFAGRPQQDLEAGIRILQKCPSYQPQEDWLNTDVIQSAAKKAGHRPRPGDCHSAHRSRPAQPVSRLS